MKGMLCKNCSETIMWIADLQRQPRTGSLVSSLHWPYLLLNLQCTATEDFTTAPVCEPNFCGSPPHVAYATYEAHNVYGENVYQSRLTYTCERDFKMSGDPVRVCDEFGYWTTEDPPVCEPITCAEPGLKQCWLTIFQFSILTVFFIDIYLFISTLFNFVSLNLFLWLIVSY